MTKKLKRSVNTKARQIVEKVREEYGYTFEEMSDLCGVAVGSVQRWYSLGRARADKIIHLEKLLENIRLPEYKIAENLISMYRDIKRPYYITYVQLRDTSGRERLSPSIVEKIQLEVEERGFVLLEEWETKNEQTVYILMRRKWCLNKATELEPKYFKDYYYRKAEEDIQEEEDD